MTFENHQDKKEVRPILDTPQNITLICNMFKYQMKR